MYIMISWIICGIMNVFVIVHTMIVKSEWDAGTMFDQQFALSTRALLLCYIRASRPGLRISRHASENS